MAATTGHVDDVLAALLNRKVARCGKCKHWGARNKYTCSSTGPANVKAYALCRKLRGLWAQHQGLAAVEPCRVCEEWADEHKKSVSEYQKKLEVDLSSPDVELFVPRSKGDTNQIKLSKVRTVPSVND
jgi:hypothetical protein